MNRLRSITLTVHDTAATARRYADWFDFRLAEKGVVDDDTARSWSAPACSGKPYVVLRPASGAKVDLRFVKGDRVPDYRPLRSYGWAAIELCVQDVMRMAERMRDSPFVIVGPPSAIPSLPTIRPMQVRGPDDEIVYLTEITTTDPADGLPIVNAPIDKPFICVLACADADATSRWFTTQLGVHVSEPIAIPYRMINRSFGFPADRLHTLCTGDDRGDIYLEFDQYPQEATVRARHDGALPPGVALCTLTCDDLDTIPGPWSRAPTARGGVIYEGARVGTLITPEGSLVEVVESKGPGRA